MANLEIVFLGKGGAAAAREYDPILAKTLDLRTRFEEATAKAQALAEKARTTGSDLDKLKADRAAQEVARLGKEMEDAGKKGGGLGKVLGDIGKAAAGFLVANVVQGAGQKVMDFVGGAIEQASQLEQSVGGVESVFKESSDKIFDFGKKAADSVGLSKNAFNQLASQTGAFLKNYGYDADQAGEKTIDLTKRAADMAAMFGGSVQDAMSAIQAGLRGQQDPLEKYGVSLTAARVEAHALAMTGKETTKTLTDQEKMAARLDLIFRQTADSAGQFAREENTAAGASERLRAKQENLAASIGEKLLPIQLKWTQLQMQAVTVLSDQVLPVVDTFISYIQAVVRDGDTLNDFLGELPAPLQGFAKTVGEVVAFVRDNWSTVSDVFGFGADYVKTRIEGMVQVVSGVIDLVTHVVNGVDDLVHGRWKSAWENFSQVPNDMAKIAVGYVKAQLGNLPQVALDLVGKGKDASGRLAKSMMDALVQGIKDGVSAYVELWTSMPQRAIDAMGDVSRVLINAGHRLMDGFKQGIRDVIPSLDDLLSSITDRIPIKKGPPEKDRVLLRPAGELVMKGFGAGLEEGWDNIARQLEGYTSAMPAAMPAAAYGGGNHGGGVSVTVDLRGAHIYGISELDRHIDRAVAAALGRGGYRGQLRTA